MTFREFAAHVLRDLFYVPPWWFRRHWRRLLVRWIRTRERWLRKPSPWAQALMRGRCVTCETSVLPLTVSRARYSEYLGGWICEDCIPSWVRAKGWTRTDHWLRTGRTAPKIPVRELAAHCERSSRTAANTAEAIASYRRNSEPSQEDPPPVAENGHSRQCTGERAIDPLSTWVATRYGEVTP